MSANEICTNFQLVLIRTLQVQCGLYGGMTLPMIYLFIKRCKIGKNSTKLLYSIGLLFLIISVIIFWNLIPILDGLCNPTHLFEAGAPLAFISTTLYMFQFVGVISIALIRAQQAFESTVLALSDITISIHILLIVAFIVTTEIGNVYLRFYIEDFQKGLDLFLVADCIYWYLAVSIYSIFIYKLVKVYKFVTTDSALIDAITKTALCSSFSVTLSVASLICTQLLEVYLNFGWPFFFYMQFTFLDVYTNALCIWLTYSCFNGYYLKLCGFPNRFCKNMWLYMMGKGDSNAVTVMKEIQSNNNNTTTLSTANSTDIIMSNPSSISTAASCSSHDSNTTPTKTGVSSKVTRDMSSKVHTDRSIVGMEQNKPNEPK